VYVGGAGLVCVGKDLASYYVESEIPPLQRFFSHHGLLLKRGRTERHEGMIEGVRRDKIEGGHVLV
jgi:hypothetical protein